MMREVNELLFEMSSDAKLTPFSLMRVAPDGDETSFRESLMKVLHDQRVFRYLQIFLLRHSAATAEIEYSNIAVQLGASCYTTAAQKLNLDFKFSPNSDKTQLLRNLMKMLHN